jgi:hypothetical protein
MRKNRRHVRDMQLLAKDLLTLDDKPNDWPAKWELERPLLAAEGLRASGRLRLRVRGESMLPSLWPGDDVEVVSCPVEDVRKGEVVLALRDGRFFLHRFLGQLPGGFLLRGDSMPAPDPEFSTEALLGRISRPIPLRWWSRAVGWLFCFCGPVRRLVLKLHGVRQQRGEVSPTTGAHAGENAAPARGQECPRFTIFSGHATRSHTVLARQSVREMPHGRV